MVLWFSIDVRLDFAKLTIHDPFDSRIRAEEESAALAAQQNIKF